MITRSRVKKSGVDNPVVGSRRRRDYSTKEWDEKSGLYYFGARYYSPEMGRWTQRDPAGTEDGLNLYLYVNNQPVSEWDPWGLRVRPAKRGKAPSDYLECIMAFKNKAKAEERLAKVLPKLEEWWEKFNDCCREVKYGTKGRYCETGRTDRAGDVKNYGHGDLSDDAPWVLTNDEMFRIPEECKTGCVHEYILWNGYTGLYEKNKKRSRRAFLKLLKECLPLLKKK